MGWMGLGDGIGLDWIEWYGMGWDWVGWIRVDWVGWMGLDEMGLGKIGNKVKKNNFIKIHKSGFET